jgi:hypothetical protein
VQGGKLAKLVRPLFAGCVSVSRPGDQLTGNPIWFTPLSCDGPGCEPCWSPCLLVPRLFATCSLHQCIIPHVTVPTNHAVLTPCMVCPPFSSPYTLLPSTCLVDRRYRYRSLPALRFLALFFFPSPQDKVMGPSTTTGTTTTTSGAPLTRTTSNSSSSDGEQGDYVGGVPGTRRRRVRHTPGVTGVTPDVTSGVTPASTTMRGPVTTGTEYGAGMVSGGWRVRVHEF